MGLLPTSYAAGASGHLAQHAQIAKKLNDVVNVKHDYGATGDGVTDDTAAFTSALTALSAGGTLYLPTGNYRIASTLTPSDGTVILGSGTQRYDATDHGARILYAGSSDAFDLSGAYWVTFRSLKIHIGASATSCVKLGSSADNHSFEDVVFRGTDTTSGTGIFFTGESTCSCHNSFRHCEFSNLQRAVRLSGFANANHWFGCSFFTVTYAFDFSATGADTGAGADNLIERCEFDGSTTWPVYGRNGAARNVFFKCTWDGTTNDYDLDSTTIRNTFICCRFGGTGTATDGSSTNSQVLCLSGSSNTGRQRQYRLAIDDTLTMTGGDIQHTRSATTNFIERSYISGEANERYRRLAQGKQQWGPGGGTAPDTTMARGGVGFMYVPMLVKAGVPADADFVEAPPNGTFAVNSLTDQLYYRKAGTWTATT